ncbi:putative F-box-like [Lyophyllum shimeji]|uniref:F-box-like n=1 Tax=Lyophyllum shimeji TaxID=47721 RepID=A0A9P3UP17_LYOSH|nr:putative F-box-like [Lyophyllum shimeji]
MGPKTPSRGAQVKADITQKLASTIDSDSSLTPEQAMRKVTMDMLANNPFVPPKGCPVNDLPPELLAYIFSVGTKMEAEEEYDEAEEEEEFMDEFDLGDGWTDEEDEGDFDQRMTKAKAGKEVVRKDGEAMDVDGEVEEEQEEQEETQERVLPFQVLVSHVCRHWREVAIESPELWTTLTFTEGPPFDKSKTWIERSKGLPLHIHIDCTIPEVEEHEFFDEALQAHYSEPRAGPAHDSAPPVTAVTHGRQYAEEHNIITPHVGRWQSLEVTASVYDYIHLLLSRLAECPAAPLLEVLELYHYEDCEDYETFRPVEFREPFLPFQGNAPKLRDVALWGVHLDWDRSLSFLTGLRDLELTYHAKDVRPSYATFKQMITSSPEIRTLSLCLSGPQEHNEETNDWGTEPIEILSLKDLVLCYHEAQYAIALVQKLSVPNVHSLALDFDGEDYSEFVRQLTRPMPKVKKSILAGLEHMKISGLPCDNQSIDMMFEQLGGLKTINLNCSGEEEEQLFRRLMKPPANKIYCPNLHTITTTGIDGAEMRAFIEARKAAGVPVKRVMMSDEDEVEEKDERWLREHLEELEFFEPSDSEEYVDITDAESGDEMDI